MHPEECFVFTDDNLMRVKDLLYSFRGETFDLSQTSKRQVFDILASVLIEALQFAQIIPNSTTTHLHQLKKEINYYSIVQNGLNNMLTIVS